MNQDWKGGGKDFGWSEIFEKQQVNFKAGKNNYIIEQS